MLKKILKWTGILLLIIIAGVSLITMLRQDLTFEAPYPSIRASTDSAIIARGKYLVYGPAHCADCHAPVGTEEAVNQGSIVNLPGGRPFVLPIGTLYAPNITSDKETGIGNVNDQTLARSLRYGVSRSNHALFNIMPFNNLSDADLTAVLSYLRTLAPVRNKVPENNMNVMGKIIKAFILKPTGPDGTPPKEVAQDSTVAYGEYLAKSVANCYGCHTKRDLKTGAFIGEPYAGGFEFESIVEPGKYMCMSPNITTDKETSVVSEWDETVFIGRFRKGKQINHSPMPWGPFSRMSDLELKALYKYLQTVKPVKNKIEKTVYERKA